MDKKIRNRMISWITRIVLGSIVLCITSAAVSGQSINNSTNANSSKDGFLVLYNGLQVNQDISKSAALNKLITLEVKDVPLLEGLNKIAEEADLEIVYDSNLLKSVDRNISLNFKYKTVKKALWTALEGTGLRFAVSEDKQLIIMKHEVERKENQAVFEIVSGVVTDISSGEALPGVNILIKGMATGTTTNIDGNFELNVESLQDTLIFSYIGYQSREVPINGRTDINVELQPQAITGEELVVVGYGTQRKADFTGSLSSVRAEDISTVNVVSPEQILRGQVAGVNVTNTSNEPGASPTIRIRGTTSINSGNEPLYVIDGIPISGNESLSGAQPRGGAPSLSPLSNIDQNDIESIDILKDASATAIYGARGSNGVVLITTKRGQVGDSQISYNGSYGVQDVVRQIPMMNRDQLIEYARASNDNANFETGQNVFFPESMNTDALPDINYQDLIFKSAPVQTHNLSVGGGNENLRYHLSGSYFNQESVVKDGTFDRYNFKANIDANVTSNIRAGATITYSYVENDRPWTVFRDNTAGGVVQNAMIALPWEPVFNEDGSRRFSNERVVPFLGNRGRPINDVDGISNVFETTRLLGNLFAEVELLEGLAFRTSIGTDISDTDNNLFRSSISNDGRGPGGIADVRRDKKELVITENVLTFNRALRENHIIDFTGGFTYQNEINKGFAGSSSQFITDAFSTYNLPAGANVGFPFNFKSSNQLTSFFGRVNYNLMNKYLITFTSRGDGSSKFGSNNKWGFFPSGAIAWRAGNEDFINNLDLFSNLKFRASYGLTGNEAIGTNQSIANLSGGTAIIEGGRAGAISLNQISNPDLKWEKTSQFDVGVDMGFLNDRLNFTFDYYYKETSDLLLRVALPQSSGFDSRLENTGTVRNKGFEASVSAIIINDQDFSWDFSGNFSLNRNSVVDLGRSSPFFVDASTPTGFVLPTLVDEGERLGAFRGWKLDGLFRDQSEVDQYISQMDPEVVNDIRVEEGFPRIVDINGDGRINSDDQTTIGDPHPDFEFGFTNRLNYKGWDLSVFVHGVIGNDILLGSSGKQVVLNFVRFNLQERVTDFWTPENRDARFPKPSENTKVAVPQRTNDFLIEDGSFVRIKDITLGRSLNFLNEANTRIYFSVQNAFTFTDYIGFDPEVNSRGSDPGTSSLNRGVDMSTFPLSRTFRLGLDITF